MTKFPRSLRMVWICGLLAFYGCRSKPEGPPLHVVSKAPEGELNDARAVIRLTFDRPVVAPGEVGKALANIPLRVRPKTALSAHWLDRQTLVATPKEPWHRATRYQVELVEPLAGRVGDAAGFAFVHDPLDVLGPTQLDRRFAPPQPEFNLVFDQKVRARDVVEHCSLTATNDEPAVALVTKDLARVDVDVPLTTQETLTQGREYRLRCEGLAPAEGAEPLAKPYETTFRVYPPLSLSESSPKSGEQATPDDLTLSLTFSTPIDRAELQKHVRITPDRGSLQREFVERGETRYELTATLEAATRYTLEIDGTLRDRFGQKLGKGQKIAFTTTDASPSLNVQNGVFTVEADAEGYPVWSRNVERFSLACAQVQKRSVVDVLTAGISYWVWYDKDRPETLDFAALGVKAHEHTVDTLSKKNKWHKTSLRFSESCGGKPRGLFLAELRAKAVEARLEERGGSYPYRVLANVTDLGVLLKVGPSSGLVWVSSLHDAMPVAGAKVSLYDSAGHRVHTGLSDAQGLLMLPGSQKLLARDTKRAEDSDPYADDESDDSYRDQRLLAIVEKDDDMAVVDGRWSDGIEAWNYNLSVDRSGGEVAVRGFIESDRGIYRPGETAHLKGLVREVPKSGEPRVPRQKRVAVRVEDAGGATIFDKALNVSAFGGFFFDAKLSEAARTGDYYVTAKLGGSTFRQTFSVEEIRPVTFEITTPGLKTNARLHATSKIPIEARYLFGAPVADAKVSWEVQRRRHWLHFDEFAEYSFEDFSDDAWSPWWEPDSYSDFVSEGEGRTDEKGRFHFRLRDSAKELTGPQDYLIRASVRDAADQEVTKRVAVTAHPSAFYLGVATDSWVATAGSSLAVHAVAVDPEGKPLAAEATLTIERVDTHCGADEGPYGYYHCRREQKRVGKRSLAMNGAAPTNTSVTFSDSGEHVLTVESKDPRGQRVRSSTSVWVIGSGRAHWASDDSHRLGLIPSKRRYVPGETAVLVPEADTDGASMLVTLERNGILEARIERGQGTSGIEVPLREAHAPNVFVSVALLRGRRGPDDSQRPELKLGMVSLPVGFTQRALNVQVETEGSDFEPGQTVQGKVRVLDAEGKPVHAEVALSAADEGVLSLIAYQTPNPLSAFYAPWGLGIQNASNWTHVAKLGAMPEGAGEEGADGAGSAREPVRSRFVASAFWAPQLVTDAAGEATFSFLAPDNLTAFRLMAAVADDGSRFGAAERRIRVRKDLLIAPVVPRFLLADDTLELGAVIHNYTDQEGEVETTFEFKGVSPRKKSVRSKIKAQGKAVVHVPVKVLAGAQAELQIRTQLTTAAGPVTGARDALSLTLPIERAVVKDTVTVFSGRGDADEAALDWTQGLDLRASRLEVAIDRTGMADLGPSLKYLVHYPYGCLEQTMSGLLPLLKVRDLVESLSLKDLPDDKIATYVRLGVDKVIRHQHPDGQFSLWPDSTPYPHLTVYALWGLNEAKRGGLAVDPRALALGLSAVRTWLNDGARGLAPGDETGTMAMAAFVMADLGEPDPALHARLFTARAALPVYGKAFLLRAMRRAQAPDSEQQALLHEIEASIRLHGDAAEVDDPIAPDGHYFSSMSRSMALVAIALLESAPASPHLAPLIVGLKQRRHGGRWESTQENVYGLYALAEYARRAAAGKTTLTVKAGQKTVHTRTLTGGAMARVEIPLSDLARGDALSFTASEPVFYDAVLNTVRPELVASALDHGFSVQRDYLDPKTGLSVHSVRVGDLLKVKLRVQTPEGRAYVAISDPLPSGFESVNTRLATERDVADDEDYGFHWDHRALRDERTDFFADGLGAGTYELSYMVRATHAGSFTAQPARAEAMYRESVMGHSQSHVLTVTR